MARHRYTEEEREFLTREIKRSSHREAAEAFAREFGWPITRTQVHCFASNHGIKAARHSRPRNSIWTEEMDAEFARFVPGHQEAEIRAHFEELFGVTLTETQIGNRKTALGVRSGTHGGRFQPGNDGGFANEEHRRKFMEAGKRTRFKKGHVPERPGGHVKPIGYERKTKDGYVEVKVKDSIQDRLNDNFMGRARVVWQKHNGPIPEGCVIRHANGIKDDDRIENLRLVRKAENSRLNSKALRAVTNGDSFDAVHSVAKLMTQMAEAKRCSS